MDALDDGVDYELPEPTAVLADVPPALRWFFLTGNRLVLAGAILVIVLVLLTATDVVAGPISREQTTPLFYLFSALTGGNFTLITIILSINQLVISQQLGTPVELRDEIQATAEYRGSIEESTELDVAPVTPTEFLHVLMRSSLHSLALLRRGTDDVEGDPREELLDTVEEIESTIASVESQLEQDDLDLFGALSMTLSTNYSRDIYDIRQLRAKHGVDYDEEIRDELDGLVVRLQQIDVARQYLKTLYMQNELSRLSRELLYVGVPAVLASVFVLRAFSASASAFTPLNLAVFVPVAITVSIAPLSVLFAYVVRISTVARRTVAITPFTIASQESPRLSQGEE
ncbi:MAG: hypothetical protein ABEJ31_05610 [Haloarculaceae archaeon]